jgi:hypothetical protein
MAQRGHHRKEVDAAIKKLKDTKQQATMAALQNSSKWEATTYAHGHNLFNLVWTSEQVPTAWRKAMLPASSKAGPWTPHNATAIAQSQFCHRQTRQQSSRATEQNVHTARSPVSVQEGHSTLDPLLAFTALEQRQRDGLLRSS